MKKIAAITEDGETISQHFGRAPYYLVLTVDEGRVVAHELRDKLGHTQFQSEPHDHDHGHEHTSGEGHGLSPEAHDRHMRMADAIADCEVLLCRGMGMGAYQSMQALGIRPVVTDIRVIGDAVQAYLAGDLVDHTEKLH
jgi:predicted Fe-Mo cluster-binding NifX family protein